LRRASIIALPRLIPDHGSAPVKEMSTNRRLSTSSRRSGGYPWNTLRDTYSSVPLKSPTFTVQSLCRSDSASVERLVTGVKNVDHKDRTARPNPVDAPLSASKLSPALGQTEVNQNDLLHERLVLAPDQSRCDIARADVWVKPTSFVYVLEDWKYAASVGKRHLLVWEKNAGRK